MAKETGKASGRGTAKATGKAAGGRGRFITFEGGEGSGKSTQIKTLAERLKAAKRRTIVTREPGGSPGAEIIRHLVLSGMGKLLGPDAETLLEKADERMYEAKRRKKMLLAAPEQASHEPVAAAVA